jgi:succinoglycan biosynthesis transport protein ExoP
MLKFDRDLSSFSANGGIWGASDSILPKIFANALRRQPILIASLFISCIAIAIAYLLTATPIYVASAFVVIDIRKGELAASPQSVRSDQAVDVGTVQTQIELMKSENVARVVIDRLRLTEDPEFVGSGASPFGALVAKGLAYFRGSPAGAPSDLGAQVLSQFESRRHVTRIAQSYVIEVAFQSSDAEKAARIANAIVEGFIDNELDAKYAALRRASIWLQARLRELQAQASDQQRTALEFRERNNIVGADGRLIHEQQLAEMNTQMSLAQAATAEAKARYERMLEIREQDVPDASTTEALKSEIIIKLREQYLKLASHESLYSQRLGNTHLAVVNIRAQMNELLRSMRDEMRKIEESYKSEYEIAQARELSITKNVANSVARSQIKSQAQIQLQELEGNAEASKALHTNFLQRFMEAAQQQSFPLTEARIADRAETPSAPTYPKKFLVGVLAAVGGVALSFGVALAREFSDRRVRSSQQVEENLNRKCIALVPAVAEESETRIAAPDVTQDVTHRGVLSLDHVLDHPLSPFTEAMRAIKVAVDTASPARSSKVIGFTSSLPGEGKSTIAANFAQLIANAGRRCVLVDADLRRSTLSRHLCPDRPGLVEAIAGDPTVHQLFQIDRRSELKILSAGSKPPSADTDEILSCEGMKQLVADLLETHDYVIVDLPPIIPVVDTRVTADFIDQYVYVVEWGQTTLDIIRHCWSISPEILEKIIGVALNKVDMSLAARYEPHQTYYRKFYPQYIN